MTERIIRQFEEYDRKIFWALVFFGAATLFLYVYFVGIAVVSVVARKATERELGRMTAEVATLESEYASLDKSVDLALAHREGFVDIASPKYLVRGLGQGNTLSFRADVGEHR